MQITFTIDVDSIQNEYTYPCPCIVGQDYFKSPFIPRIENYLKCDML